MRLSDEEVQGYIIQTEDQESCELDQVATVLFLMGHPFRLKMICALGRGEMNVTQLTEMLGNVTQSNVSQHLKVMKKAGIVSARRDCNQIFYSVVNASLFPVISRVQEIFCGKQEETLPFQKACAF